MVKIGPWVDVSDNGSELGYHTVGEFAYRAIKGMDGTRILYRVAMIEKTPRVRIRPQHQGHDSGHPDHDWLNWCEGPKGNGPGDPKSRKWCDDMLKLLGYES